MNLIEGDYGGLSASNIGPECEPTEYVCPKCGARYDNLWNHPWYFQAKALCRHCMDLEMAKYATVLTQVKNDANGQASR